MAFPFLLFAAWLSSALSDSVTDIFDEPEFDLAVLSLAAAFAFAEQF